MPGLKNPGFLGRGHIVPLSKQNLVSQTSAALITTSLENLSAVSGSHSLPEAMFLTSLSLFRLICSEHMHTSFSRLFPLYYRKFLFFRECVCAHFPSLRTDFRTLQIDNNYYIPLGWVVSRGFSKKISIFTEKVL